LTTFLLGSTLNTPVENIVILVTFTNKKIMEHFAEIGIVRLVVKAESTSVISKYSKLVRESSIIRSYFCFLVAALRPCHGRAPRRKYIRT
jgi:hypothetical protein